ncbi:Cell Division Cycle 5-Like Protein [Manis pentadactyla]|nr:Cell Division Cycle 5-Like Protein [Manis pentadactyla]
MEEWDGWGSMLACGSAPVQSSSKSLLIEALNQQHYSHACCLHKAFCSCQEPIPTSPSTVESCPWDDPASGAEGLRGGAPGRPVLPCGTQPGRPVLPCSTQPCLETTH